MSVLVMVKTPFQAWLVEKVLTEEGVSVFDVFYLTYDDSAEDIYYYNKLSLKCRNSEYFVINANRHYALTDILLKVKLWKWYRKYTYDTLIASSIDALFVSLSVRKYCKSELITFDDGTANIHIDSCYHLESKNKKFLIYRYLMNGLSLEKVKKNIVKHYTVYKGYKNIVDSTKLFYLDGWSESIRRDKAKTKTYFIGSPFSEVMTENEISRLESYVRELDVDFYVNHPREHKILDVGVKILNKCGRIAEEAIIYDAGDCSIILVGWFSTVMLNLGPLCKSRIVLLPKESSLTPEAYKLSKKAGCTPILF